MKHLTKPIRLISLIILIIMQYYSQQESVRIIISLGENTPIKEKTLIDFRDSLYLRKPLSMNIALEQERISEPLNVYRKRAAIKPTLIQIQKLLEDITKGKISKILATHLDTLFYTSTLPEFQNGKNEEQLIQASVKALSDDSTWVISAAVRIRDALKGGRATKEFIVKIFEKMYKISPRCLEYYLSRIQYKYPQLSQEIATYSLDYLKSKGKVTNQLYHMFKYMTYQPVILHYLNLEHTNVFIPLRAGQKMHALYMPSTQNLGEAIIEQIYMLYNTGLLPPYKRSYNPFDETPISLHVTGIDTLPAGFNYTGFPHSIFIQDPPDIELLWAGIADGPKNEAPNPLRPIAILLKPSVSLEDFEITDEELKKLLKGVKINLIEYEDHERLFVEKTIEGIDIQEVKNFLDKNHIIIDPELLAFYRQSDREEYEIFEFFIYALYVDKFYKRYRETLQRDYLGVSRDIYGPAIDDILGAKIGVQLVEIRKDEFEIIKQLTVPPAPPPKPKGPKWKKILHFPSLRWDMIEAIFISSNISEGIVDRINKLPEEIRDKIKIFYGLTLYQWGGEIPKQCEIIQCVNISRDSI